MLEMNQDPPVVDGIQKIKLIEIALLIGGVVIALLNQVSRSSLEGVRGSVAFVLIIFGCFLFFLGAWSLEQNNQPAWFARALQAVAGWFSIKPVQVIFILVAIPLSITATNAAGFGVYLLDQFVSLFSWVLSIILLVFAGWEREPESIRANRRILLYMLAVFLVAFALRGINTTHYPFVLSSDEAFSGLGSIGFLEQKTNNIFITYWFSFPSFYNYLQSYGIALFGRTIPGLRLMAAFIGSLSVVTLFLVVKAMYGLRTSLLAAIFLAFSHYHIQFSRLGLNNIWDGLSFIVALGALWWAWTTERRAAFILSGLAIGFSQYFYTTGHGVPVVALLWLVLMFFKDRQKFKRMLPNMLFLGLAAMVVILPLAWFYVFHPTDLTAPMDRVTIFSDWLPRMVQETGYPAWRVILNQFITSLLSFTDRNLLYWYTPEVPILRPAMAIFFYFGVGLMLFRIKDNRAWMVFLWLGLFVFSGALSDSTPAAQRYIASTPACLIIVAYGLDRLFQLIDKAIPQIPRIISTVAIATALIIGINDSYFYFFEYTPRHTFGDFHSHIAQRLSDYLQDYDDSWEVIFAGYPAMGYHSVLSLSYLNPQINGRDMVAPWGDQQNPVPEKKNVIFVFTERHEADFLACKEQYPGGEVITEYSIRNELMYYLYKVQFDKLPAPAN